MALHNHNLFKSTQLGGQNLGAKKKDCGLLSAHVVIRIGGRGKNDGPMGDIWIILFDFLYVLAENNCARCPISD